MKAKRQKRKVHIILFYHFIRNIIETRLSHACFPKLMHAPVECLISETCKPVHNVSSYIIQTKFIFPTYIIS